MATESPTVQLRIDAKPRERSPWVKFAFYYDPDGEVLSGSYSVINGETWVYGTEWRRANDG